MMYYTLTYEFQFDWLYISRWKNLFLQYLKNITSFSCLCTSKYTKISIWFLVPWSSSSFFLEFIFFPLAFYVPLQSKCSIYNLWMISPLIWQFYLYYFFKSLSPFLPYFFPLPSSSSPRPFLSFLSL